MPTKCAGRERLSQNATVSSFSRGRHLIRMAVQPGEERDDLSSVAGNHSVVGCPNGENSSMDILEVD